jgi:hypothetical protein
MADLATGFDSSHKDAPSLAEIEITEEMIEAGADVIRFHSLDDYRATEIALLVFRSMASCRDCAPKEK